MWFAPYVAALQILHIINVALVGLLLRKLKLPFIAACAGAVFFAFDMALFSAYWEPMFVFDVICGLFCLLSMVAYIDGHWIVSFLSFWLAYRAKENAIMLPVVFLAYEWHLGNRRWKRLIPFFALSAILGAQALLNNVHRESSYTLHFDPVSVWKCMAFYSSRVLLIPYAGFAIFALLLLRNKRVWFGVAAFCILLVPMLALPGRLFSVYLYVPVMGLAICVGALAQWQPKTVIALLIALWIPWNFVNLRWLRNAEMARADAARYYVANLVKLAKKYPSISTFLYHDLPMEFWGVSATVHLMRPGWGTVKVLNVGDREAKKLMETQPVVLLDWQPTPIPGSLVALAHTAETPDVSYVRMGRDTPVWQLEQGWNFGERGAYRWIAPHAMARLMRPANARQFELIVNATAGFLEYVHRSHLRVSIDGRLIGERDFERAALETVRWNLDKAPAGPVRVVFDLNRGFKTAAGGDELGLSIGSFGFITQ
jgi:hypothetical protein